MTEGDHLERTLRNNAREQEKNEAGSKQRRLEK
jgi:hypothetical protein